MVIVERKEGQGAVLRGRNDNERMEVPWWPCTAAIIRRKAPNSAPRKWVDECAKFANDEYTRS